MWVGVCVNVCDDVTGGSVRVCDMSVIMWLTAVCVCVDVCDDVAGGCLYVCVRLRVCVWTSVLMCRQSYCPS